MTTRANPGDAPAPTDFTPVALAFLEEQAERRGGTLARYIERYPHYAPDLIRLACETAALDEQEIAGVAPPAALRARLREDARATLMASPTAEESPAAPGLALASPLVSLLARGRNHAGLTPRALAQRLDISIDVLALAEERHLRPETVPVPFLRRVAEALGTTASAVSAYLAVPSLPATHGVAYHAPRGHAPARTLAFAQAIEESALMTDEQKAYWLAQTPDQGDGDR